jgi:hypothetical protein
MIVFCILLWTFGSAFTIDMNAAGLLAIPLADRVIPNDHDVPGRPSPEKD